MNYTNELQAGAKRLWDRDAELRADFSGNFDGFDAYCKAVIEGRARSCGKVNLSEDLLAQLNAPSGEPPAESGLSVETARNDKAGALVRRFLIEQE